ncbi:hypothetical protein ACS0TY_007752 [Phlomoides rotata]
MIYVIKLNGLLHSDNNCALKASFDENSQFLLSILRYIPGYLVEIQGEAGAAACSP